MTTTYTQAPTERARTRFIERCEQIARHDSNPAMCLMATAARDFDGTPALPWDTLQWEVNCWQRVRALQGPAAAAERFQSIVAALTVCERCNGTGETCAECCEASDNGDCGGSCIHVPCPCAGVKS
jgi:hypothetical protein